MHSLVRKSSLVRRKVLHEEKAPVYQQHAVERVLDGTENFGNIPNITFYFTVVKKIFIIENSSRKC